MSYEDLKHGVDARRSANQDRRSAAYWELTRKASRAEIDAEQVRLVGLIEKLGRPLLEAVRDDVWKEGAIPAHQFSFDGLKTSTSLFLVSNPYPVLQVNGLRKDEVAVTVDNKHALLRIGIESNPKDPDSAQIRVSDEGVTPIRFDNPLDEVRRSGLGGLMYLASDYDMANHQPHHLTGNPLKLTEPFAMDDLRELFVDTVEARTKALSNPAEIRHYSEELLEMFPKEVRAQLLRGEIFKGRPLRDWALEQRGSSRITRFLDRKLPFFEGV